MSSYYEKLRHPLWQKKRTQIMQRDNFTCVSCGNTEKTLNVHHKTYRKGADPWDYDDDNFITYCEDCHLSYHEEKNVLLIHVDSVEKIRRLATISYYCDAQMISLGQLVCAFAAIERGIEIRPDDLAGSRKLAAKMILECKEFLQMTKPKKIKK